jgi:gas vesicle protein
MRDHDDLPYIVIERHSAGFGAFIWGLIIGAGAALLLAPRSGAETQEEIRGGVQRVKTAASDKVDAARSTVHRTRERVEDSVDAVRDRFGNVRDRIATGAEEARSAVETGRRSAREALDRHVGDTDAEPGSTRDRSTLDAAAMAAAPTIDREVEIVVTEVTRESTEGRSDLG